MIFLPILFVSVFILCPSLNAQNNNLDAQSTAKMLEVERLMQEADYIFEGTVVWDIKCHNCEPIIYSNTVKIHKVFRGAVEFGNIEIMCSKEEKEKIDSPYKKGQQGLFFANKNGPEILKIIDDCLPDFLKRNGPIDHFSALLEEYNNQLSLEAIIIPYKVLDSDSAVIRFNYNEKPFYFSEVNEVYPFIEKYCDQPMVDYDKIIMNRDFLGEGTPFPFRQNYTLKELKEKLGNQDDCYKPEQLTEQLNKLLPEGNEFRFTREIESYGVLRFVYQHFYREVEVYGSKLAFYFENNCVTKMSGAPIMLNHSYLTYLDIDSVRNIALQRLGTDVLIWKNLSYYVEIGKHNLRLIYPKENLYWKYLGGKRSERYCKLAKDFELIYEFKIHGLSPVIIEEKTYYQGFLFHIQIDAFTGEILKFVKDDGFSH